MKNALDKKGLLMSQAQTISNLANHAATDMLARLSMTNNAKKTVTFKDKDLVQIDARPLPATLEDQLQTIGEYRSLQAFLMEQLKAKEGMLKEVIERLFTTKLEHPKQPTFEKFEPIIPIKEEWGWNQLTMKELTDYWEAEAMAAVYGKFIHSGGTLDRLRKELPNIASLEWFVAPGHQGEAWPVKVEIHAKHTELELWDLHQALANIHRDWEQKVNYFKAKVKNLVTLENARISKENGVKVTEVNKKNVDLRNSYVNEVEKHNGEIQQEQQKFEEDRQMETKKIAGLRIKVDDRFQKLIDELMPKDSEQESEEKEEDK